MVSNGENSQLNLHLHGNKYGKIIQVFMADSILEMEDHPTDQRIGITIQATVGKIKKKHALHGPKNRSRNVSQTLDLLVSK